MRLPRLAFGIAPLAVMVVLAAPLAQGEASYDEIRLQLRQELLNRLNGDRTAAGLAPLAIDLQASLIADRYCQRQIENGTTGHFTTDGQTPYMRYSMAGGNDGLSENAAAWSANYAFTPAMIPQLIQKSEDAMLAERAPHDGHRRAILDPFVTHVGLGMAWRNGEFRMTEELLRRYVEWYRPVPRAASIGEKVRIGGKTVDGFVVSAISIHREPFPEPISASAANQIETYSLPRRRHDYLPRLGVVMERARDGSRIARWAGYSDGRKGDFTLAEDGSFAFDVPFPDGPGIYTVVVWVHRTGESTPISASNISIRVDRAFNSGNYATSSR